MRLSVFMATAASVLAVGCASPSSGSGSANNVASNNGGKADRGGDVTMCAAIRGNGELIPAHFGSLARLVEYYGPIHAAAGGSSGSITTFLLSSMEANKLTSQCGDSACSPTERANRVALLLKSFQGYLEFLAQTDEFVAVENVIPIVKQVQDQGLAETVKTDPQAALDALNGILKQPGLAKLVNPELLDLLKNSPNPTYHVKDIIASIQSFGDFKADDPKILVRPGLLNWKEVASRLAMAGSFYAGYGKYDSKGMEAWLEDCATPGFGKSWSEVRDMPHGDSTCGKAFYAMLGTYRDAYQSATAPPSRGDDPVGYLMPSLISTSVITGGGVDAWNAAREQYDSGTDPTLDVNFDDIKFGYFGSPEATSVLKRTRERSDLKSQKAIDLGAPKWTDILSVSPAEPGLSRAQAVDDAHISAGGWSDLHPVLVLKDLGCDKVVYITRTDPESTFARGVAGLLGMSAEQDDALYSLDNPDSSFSQSIQEADAVWCTNWNNIPATKVDDLVNDAYNAPMQTTDPYFTDAKNPYPNITSDTGLPGCTIPE